MLEHLIIMNFSTYFTLYFYIINLFIIYHFSFNFYFKDVFIILVNKLFCQNTFLPQCI